MVKTAVKAFGLLCICGTLTIGGSMITMAAAGPGYETSTSLIVSIDAHNVPLYAERNESSAVLTQAAQGNRYEVLESTNDGWVKIKANDAEGFVKIEDNASLIETTTEVAEAVDETVNVRQNVVDYAMQFIGNRYQYGGNDPNTGVDCSGFTRYVMQHGAGIGINRSSGSQATQGRPISAEEIQPGDLIFYGNGSRINHVGMYIGNEQIVHASTERTGIKVSNWTYRNPVKIINVIG